MPMGLFADLFASKAPSDFFSGVTDIHSHILPGVDDGVRDRKGYDEAVEEFSSLGFKSLILTPHVMTDYGSNCRRSLSEAFSALPSHPSLKMRLAAEYMIDADFLRHRDEGLLTLDENGKYLLVESSYVDCYADFDRLLYEICLDGMVPVIAHPERYSFADDKMYESWKDKGYLFQLNFMSLSGRYGPQPMVKSRKLLDSGMYDFAGSDLHHPGSLSGTLSRLKLRTVQWDAIRSLFENNGRIFQA